MSILHLNSKNSIVELDKKPNFIYHISSNNGQGHWGKIQMTSKFTLNIIISWQNSDFPLTLNPSFCYWISSLAIKVRKYLQYQTSRISRSWSLAGYTSKVNLAEVFWNNPKPFKLNLVDLLTGSWWVRNICQKVFYQDIFDWFF